MMTVTIFKMRLVIMMIIIILIVMTGDCKEKEK